MVVKFNIHYKDTYLLKKKKSILNSTFKKKKGENNAAIFFKNPILQNSTIFAICIKELTKALLFLNIYF